eukprot:3767948-Amphidinium_carterae.1
MGGPQGSKTRDFDSWNFYFKAAKAPAKHFEELERDVASYEASHGLSPLMDQQSRSAKLRWRKTKIPGSHEARTWGRAGPGDNKQAQQDLCVTQTPRSVRVGVGWAYLR